MKPLVIFGTGEIGSLARFYFENDSDYTVAAFCADDEYVRSETFENLPLVKLSELSAKYPPQEYIAHVALSYRRLNQIRKEKYFTLKEMGYTLASYVCSKSVCWNDLNIGDNCFILENQTIQPTVEIGNNVMIWSGNHLGHGCRIEDHVYISSHVCIAGHVTIKERCFLGINSTIRDFVTIGEGCFVTMNASVTQDLAGGSVVADKGARVFDADSPQAKAIIEGYFFK